MICSQLDTGIAGRRERVRFLLACERHILRGRTVG